MQARNVVLKSLYTSHVRGLVEDFLTFASNRRAMLARIMELRGKLEDRCFSAVPLCISRFSLMPIAKRII